MINRIKNYFKDITGNVRVFGATSLFNDASTEMIYPLLPLFLTSVLGAGAGFVGLVEGVAEATASIGKLVAGWYSDKFQSRKKIAVFGYSLSTLTRPMIAIATAPWHILGARFIDRIGKGIRTSPRDALLAASVNPANKGKAFGFHRAMDHAGAIIGPAAAMLLLHFFPNDLRLVFWVAAIPGLLAVFALQKYAVEVKPKLDPSKVYGPPKLSWSALDPCLRKYILVVFIFTLGNSSDAFLLLRAQDLGVSIAMIPALWIVLHIVKVVTAMPGGGLSDKIGRRKVIIFGWLVYALIYAGFALASKDIHAWALFALYGIYFGLTEGAERAFVSDLACQENTGTAFGYFHMAVGIASLPASIGFGLVWKRFGSQTAFLMGAALAFVAMIMLAILVKEIKPEKGTIK